MVLVIAMENLKTSSKSPTQYTKVLLGHETAGEIHNSCTACQLSFCLNHWDQSFQSRRSSRVYNKFYFKNKKWIVEKKWSKKLSSWTMPMFLFSLEPYLIANCMFFIKLFLKLFGVLQETLDSNDATCRSLLCLWADSIITQTHFRITSD